MKFKIGDKVRILDANASKLCFGEVHKIDEVLSYEEIYVIKNRYFKEWHLELAEEAPENSREFPLESTRTTVETEIEILESSIKRFERSLAEKRARLEAYKEFQRMLEEK